MGLEWNGSSRSRLAKLLLLSLTVTLRGGVVADVMAQSCPPLVDITTDDDDEETHSDKTSHGEPTLAVRPNPQDPRQPDIAIVAHSGNWNERPAPVWRSVDGGNTWKKHSIIAQPTSGSSFAPMDHTVAFDSGGRLLVSLLDKGTGYVYAETQAGQMTLKPGAPFGNRIADQPQLVVDHSSARCAGRTYVAWLELGQTGNRSTVSVSRDGGNTWCFDKTLGSHRLQRTTRIAVGPDGSVYAVFKATYFGSSLFSGKFEKVNFRVVRSDNCGDTWNALTEDGQSIHESGEGVYTWFTAEFGNKDKGKVALAKSSDAWIAADQASGDVYVAYTNKKDESEFGQIYVARSTDQGATWHSARVTDGTHHSAYPEIAVAQNGVVGVLYIDYDDSGQNTIFRHRLARSYDKGVSWKDKIVQQMDPKLLENAMNQGLWRDYNGLVAAGNSFYGVFTGASIPETKKRQHPIFFCESADAQPR